MRRNDLRRWAEGHREAQRRERDEALAAGPDPVSAIAGALGLVALAGRLHGWPLAADEADRRDEALARARWDRLRTALMSRDRAG